MQHGNAVVRQHRRNLVPHPHHVFGGVAGAAGAGGDVALPLRHGVGLAAVGVQDQHLGRVAGQLGGKAFRRQRGGIQRFVGAVLDAHAPHHRVARGVGDLHRLGGHAVILKGQRRPGRCRERRLWVYGGRVRLLRLIRFRFLRRVLLSRREVGHVAAGRQQQGGLSQHQRRGGGQPVRRQPAAQRPTQQPFCGAAAIRGAVVCGGGHCHQRHGRQHQRRTPAQPSFHHVHHLGQVYAFCWGIYDKESFALRKERRICA